MKKKLTFTYKNKEFTVKEFSDTYCVGYSTIVRKLAKGETLDDIIKSKRSRKSPVICKNKTYDSILDFCSNFNITYREFVDKLSSGLSVQEIVDELLAEVKNNKISNEETINKEDKSINNNTSTKKTSKIQPPIIIYSMKGLMRHINNNLGNFNKINLIDFENVSKDKIVKDIVNDPLNLNIFFFNGCIYSNDFYKLTSNSVALNYYIISLEVEDQLIDHLLLYYLGALSNDSLLSNIKFNIVSKDTHFYKLRKYINTINIDNIGLNYISDINGKFIYSLSNYIINNNYIHNNTCLFKKEFQMIFGNFFKLRNKVINNEEIDKLINILLELEFITLNPETDNTSEYYTINLIKIKQENRRLRKQARAK